MVAPVRKYNPGFLTNDELVGSFCIRTTEFEMLLEALRDCTGPANQHQLVIGPRGSGKTTLLLRVAAETRRDPALAARCFPIVFAEESYEVSTAGEFWLECLTLLAAQAPRADDQPDLYRTVEDLRTISDDRTLADRCLGALMDFADRHDQRLLLLAENLNMLFRDMTDRDAGWRLRKILQTEPRIILFASATSRFREIDHPEHALYDLFRVRTLRPLDTGQCKILWNAATGRTPPTATIRSLEILTGGNPRLLAIVARFGAARSFRQLMADLLDLVDDHTEYFKSHLDALAAQERRVYLALAALWKPATTREIADQARLDTNTCSAQLARLRDRGAVHVTGGTAKRKQYYLTERLYNIYYLLRRHRTPDRLVEALIRFMESFYSAPELKDVAAYELAHAVDDWHPPMQLLHESILKELLASPTLAPYSEELKALRPRPRLVPNSDEQSATQLLQKLRTALRIELSPDEQLDVQVVAKLRELIDEDRLNEILAICDTMVHRYGQSKNPVVVQAVTDGLLLKGCVFTVLSRPMDALDACTQAVELAKKERRVPPALESLALMGKAIALVTLNQLHDALAAFNQVIERFAKSKTPPVLSSVAMAFALRGSVLNRLKRPHEALAACDQATEHIGQSDIPGIVQPIAVALKNRGIAFKTLNRPDDALATYYDAASRLGKNDFRTTQIGVLAIEALIERATVAVVAGDRPACERDLREALSVLADAAPLCSNETLMALIELSVDLGPRRMSELIRESPSEDFLLPLATALEREIGNEPRVAQEVDEVAHDILRQLKKIREDRERRATELDH